MNLIQYKDKKSYPYFILVLILFLYQIIGSTFFYILFGEKIENRIYEMITLMFSQFIFILLPILFFSTFETNDLKNFFRLNFKIKFSQIIFSLIGLFSLSQILGIFISFQDTIPLPEWLSNFRSMMENKSKNITTANSIGELFFVIFVIAITPAICEEIFFRGFIQRKFEKIYTSTFAYVLSGTIFGIYHFNPFHIIGLIGLGIYFGFLVYHSNSIFLSMIAHFLNNTFAVILLYFGIDESSIMSIGNIFSIETFFYLLIYSLVFVFSIFYFLKFTAKKNIYE